MAEKSWIVGTNGAGKTTTFYMIVGCINLTRGRSTLTTKTLLRSPCICGREKESDTFLKSHRSSGKLTTEENLMAILETLPLSKEERKTRLEKFLDELDSPPCENRRPMSLGRRAQAVEITRALVLSPSFILLDEPFSGLILSPCWISRRLSAN